MSSLSILSLPKISSNQLWLRIDRIHPDAPRLSWLTEQDLPTLKVMSIFRVMKILEAHQKQENALYKLIYNRLNTSFGGEMEELSVYTELTEDGTWVLDEVIDDLVLEAEIVEQDLNDNWETGALADFNPNEIEKFANPFLTICLKVNMADLPPELQGLYHFSALGITCTE